MNELERSLAFAVRDEDLAAVRALPPAALPGIAVVIPSFNQAAFLRDTLESVFAQQYPRMEIFVADGGSKDGSVEILREYAARHPERLRFESAPDGGQAQGVNKALANTSLEIVAWINSDDVYLPDAFWKAAAFFHFNRGALVAYGRNRYVDRNLRPVVDYPVDWSPLLTEQRRRMMHFCIVPQPSLFFRRVAVTLCGGLAQTKLLDYELWLRWQDHLPFHFIDDVLSLSRLHDEAITANADTSLLVAICKTVHAHYGVVPMSWALKLAYTRMHGAAWARGNAPPVGARVRALAAWNFAWLNLRWMPRAACRLALAARRTLVQALRSSS